MKHGIGFISMLFLLCPVPGFSATSDLYKVTGSATLANGTTMMFRLFVPPGYDGSKKHPLVLLMHGIEATGSDNARQLNTGLIGLPWIADSIQRKYAPFVLAPQCPSGLAWASNGSADQAGNGAIKILDSLAKAYSLDTTRYYLAGYSWGGIGAWGMMKSYPGKFAAAVPCAGNAGFSASAAGIKGATLALTPFWAFHGDADDIVNVSGTRNAVASVEGGGTGVLRFTSKSLMADPTGISADSLGKAVAGGTKFLYSEIIGGSHAAGCTEAWRNKLLCPWMFSKAKVAGKSVDWPNGAAGLAEEAKRSRISRGSGTGTGGIRLGFARGGMAITGLAGPSHELRILSVDGAVLPAGKVRTGN